MIAPSMRQFFFFLSFMKGAYHPGSGASFTGADRIHWEGKVWRVVRVRDWNGFGYYQGYAVLLREGE